MYGILFPEKDRFIMEISIDMPVTLNLVFAIIRKNEAKKILDIF